MNYKALSCTAAIFGIFLLPSNIGLAQENTNVTSSDTTQISPSALRSTIDQQFEQAVRDIRDRKFDDREKASLLTRKAIQTTDQMQIGLNQLLPGEANASTKGVVVNASNVISSLRIVLTKQIATLEDGDENSYGLHQQEINRLISKMPGQLEKIPRN